MNELIQAIRNTPIIDNHAHPLLKPSFINKYPLLTITTEAHGSAIDATRSSLSHIRAVNQLSKALKCEATWEAVEKAVQVERDKGELDWEKRCFEGIETLLVDDGLDGEDEVYGYGWHDKMVRGGGCKRIVRIEKVAEKIIEGMIQEAQVLDDYQRFKLHFRSVILDAIADPEVVGFKSVICYRAGLGIQHIDMSDVEEELQNILFSLRAAGTTSFTRIDEPTINSALVTYTAQLISESAKPRKPFQFHTGLGDNDITLTKSSPSHMQPFIKRFPKVPIVLLHASYPWTQEAGYLATVYDNVYADIGEVFPFLSQDGQERVIREILELCPTEKICWSTDGHWFPETYFLAVTQVKEALEVVLPEYVEKKALSIPQAIEAVQNIFFHTSNKLYNLKLPFNLLEISTLASPSGNHDFQHPKAFLAQHTSVKFLRLQYEDYTAISRLRIIPIKKALQSLADTNVLEIGITKACLGLLQNDHLAPGVTPTGEYKLRAVLSSLRLGPSPGYATLQGEFYETDGSESRLCPRSLLRRTLKTAEDINLQFLIGFEIEIVFLSRDPKSDQPTTLTNSAAHAWCSFRSLHSPQILKLLNDIYDTLSTAGIELEQFHPEGATGQHEFVLPPLPPLEAVDVLIHARSIISTIVAANGLLATLHPKPFPEQCGTAAHAHISISSENGEDPKVYEPFYQGILSRLHAITAFTYSNPVSYDRVKDGLWAGGRYIAWGTQNKETPLRKIAGSHWEIKCLDGLANMYLAMSAILAAGIIGVKEGMGLRYMDCDTDPASLSEKERREYGIEKMMYGSLEDSLLSLDHTLLNELLGWEVVERYCNVKRAEIGLMSTMSELEKWRWIVERY